MLSPSQKVYSYPFQPFPPEGSDCSDFYQQRLVLPVQVQIYSVTQQVKQEHMSVKGMCENVHSSFIMASNGKSSNAPSPSEWINKLWSIHAVERGSAVRRNWPFHPHQHGGTTQTDVGDSCTRRFHVVWSLIHSTCKEEGEQEVFVKSTHTVTTAIGDSVLKGQGPRSVMCRVPPIPAS